MTVPKKAKTPLAGGALEKANSLPVRPWKGKRRLARWQADDLPPLECLHHETNVLRALLVKPTHHVLYSRHFTLAKNRWIGAERVARAALRAGYSPVEAARLLLSIFAEHAPDGCRFTASCAAWIVDAQKNRPAHLVVKPSGDTPRIMGVV